MGQYILDNFSMARHMEKVFYYFLMDHTQLEHLKTTCFPTDNILLKDLNIKDNSKRMFFMVKDNKRI
jgi:hypothetical protein